MALAALILGQIGLHSCMTGVRMAAPLQALQQGHSPGAVGVLMALFSAATIVLALPAGRMADRHGYHRPLAVAAVLSLAGGVVAALSGDYLALCVAALLTGAGANVGLITVQRTAGRVARTPAERMRIFGWTSLAPALSNTIGPALAGLVIDAAGYRAAFGVLVLLPLVSWFAARRVPRETPAPPDPVAGRRAPAWDLLRAPAMRHLLLLNWLVSASWDVHAFVLPLLGHERGMSASAIGGILGAFALAVAGVRLLVPLFAHRISESRLLGTAMLCSGCVFAVYPFAPSAWSMAGCAVLLGTALGSVQPVIMSTLHHITPSHRHGEAIALRSVAINLSSSLMPMAFGALGAALGASALFWLMGAAVGGGSLQARRLASAGSG